jgi:stage II sporulation protein D
MRRKALLALVFLLPGCSAAPRGRPVPPAAIAPQASAPPAAPAPPAEAVALTPPVLRVGLASDLSEATLPGRGLPWMIIAGKDRLTRRGPLAFAPGGGAAVWRLQVGAFTEEAMAKSAAGAHEQQFHLPATVAFSAEKGLYLVRLGQFPGSAEARAAAAPLEAAGIESFAVSENAGGSFLTLRDETGADLRLPATADALPPAGTLVEFHGKRYRGGIRVLTNARGLLTVVNLVPIEDYLRGVVPAEMGPKRFDELEALKAQAVAARTYAIDNRGQFEAEGYDLCATPKCQAYGGADVEDPLSDAAVEQTKGLVALYGGKPIHALFSSTCGGSTEDAAVIFPSMAQPYLTSVACAEAEATTLVGSPPGHGRASGEPLSALEWRGEVLLRQILGKRQAPSRRILWAEGLALCGIRGNAGPPSGSSPGEVYAALAEALGLRKDEAVHLTALDRAYDKGPPDAAPGLAGAGRDAYETLVRLKFPGSATFPVRRLNDRELAGVLASAALRMSGIVETSGRMATREGGSLMIKTSAGRVAVPADSSLVLARKVGEQYWPAATLALRPGDAVRFWKQGNRVLALWVEHSPAGATFEKESSWTEWVRRVSGRELAIRAGHRVTGTEVRAVEVTRRGRSGRAIEAKISTDRGAFTLSGFDLRQALELPDLLFTVHPVFGTSGNPEFVFIGRGWGHGVGLCQNGAYGMALAGRRFEEILGHYYPGVEIRPAP